MSPRWSQTTWKRLRMPILPIAGPAPEKASIIPDEVKQVVSSAVDAPHAATAQEPQEVERAWQRGSFKLHLLNVRLNINVHSGMHRSRQISRKLSTLLQRMPLKLKNPFLRPRPNRSQEPHRTWMLLVSVGQYQ
jgi:hypothetical protein